MSSVPKISRRGFIVAITGSALAASLGCNLTGTYPSAPSSDISRRSLPALPLTKDRDLFVVQHDFNKTPRVDAESWRLTVDGLVETPLSLTYAQILVLPVYEETRTLACVNNPVGGNLIGTLVWKGFQASEILKRVMPKAGARYVRFEAADGYSNSLPLEQFTAPGTMFAYALNGEPLSVAHGFPLRIHVPGLYGLKMPRWLTAVHFTDQPYQGFWESRGWSERGTVQTQAIFRAPDGALRAGQPLMLGGIAFAGNRRIAKVEVQIDGGPWMVAHLEPGASPLACWGWALPWTFSAPGVYQIGVRATDESGYTQMQEGIADAAFPDGANAIHRVALKVTS